MFGFEEIDRLWIERWFGLRWAGRGTSHSFLPIIQSYG